MRENRGKVYCRIEGKDVLPITVRLMEVNEKDGETVCTIETIPYLCYDCSVDYLLSNYVAVAPQLVEYLVVYKDAPIADSLYLVIEPYSKDGFESAKQAVVINLFKAILTPNPMHRFAMIASDFSLRRPRDGIEFIKDVKGYKDAVVGDVWHVYYDDPNQIGLVEALRGNDQAQKALELFLKDKEAQEQLKRYESISSKNDDLIKAKLLWCKLASYATACLLGTFPIKQRWIELIKQFVQTRTMDNEVQTALRHVLLYSGNSADSVNDPVFQSSILVFLLDPTKIDLEQVKRENRLYTVVVAKTEKHRAWVIMYRLQPIEFRVPEQTGFNEQEMAKLLG